MPQNKKQHFVPRFYLRRFSADRKSINLYNLVSGKTILRANVKNQCYENYFYGEDLDAERSVAQLEERAAKLLRLIDEQVATPRSGTASHSGMVIFILAQYFRTAHAAAALDETHDKVMKYLFRSRAEAEGIDLDSVFIGVQHPARFLLQWSMQAYPFIMDLRHKLLVNKSDSEFITSDNPVVLCNPFLAFRTYTCNTGLVCKGIKIFFPIDPDKALLLYDDDVYRIGKDACDVVEVSNPRDVHGLNALAMCSADANVYFRDATLDAPRLHKRVRPFRRSKRSNVDIYTQWQTDEQRSDILATSPEDVRFNPVLSFVAIRRHAKAWRVTFRKQATEPVVVARNERRAHDCEEFVSLVENGKYQAEDFGTFLVDKYGSG